MTTYKKWMAVLAGIFYVLVALYLFLNPGVQLATLSWLLAFVFFIGASSNLTVFFSTPKELRPKHRLWQAILAFLFALYLVLYGYATLPVLIPTIISIWLFFMAGLAFVKGVQIRGERNIFSNLLLSVGVTAFVIGLVLFFHPVMASLLVTYLISIVFLFQGIVFLADAIHNL